MRKHANGLEAAIPGEPQQLKRRLVVTVESANVYKALRDANFDDCSIAVRLEWQIDRDVHDTPVVQVEDELLEELNEISGVKNGERLHTLIAMELSREWEWHGRIIPISRKRRLDQLERIARLASELRNCLSDTEPSHYTRSELRKVLRVEELAKRDCLPASSAELESNLGTLIARISSFADAASTWANACQQKPEPRRRRGRPNTGGWGNIDHPGSLLQFTVRILWDVREAGGTLTLNKNNGAGTLGPFLSALRPHTPPRLIAKILPWSTLNRAKLADQKITAVLDPR